MRLVTYQHEGQSRSGALLDDKVVDLNRAYHAALQHAGNEDELAVANARVPIDMIGLLKGGETSLRAAGQVIAFARNQLEGKESPTRIESAPQAPLMGATQQGIVYAIDHVSL